MTIVAVEWNSIADVVQWISANPPLPINNLIGNVTSSNTIRWSWSGDTSTTQYKVYNADTSQLIGTSTSMYYDETGITLGNTYNRYVIASNLFGDSSKVNITLVTSLLANFKGIPLTSTSIKWTWDIYTTVEKFIIYDDKNVKLTEIPSGTTEWVQTELTPNTPYACKISYVKDGIEQNSVIASATTYPILIPVQNTTATNVTYNSISWNWSDSGNQGVTAYEILNKNGFLLYSTNANTKTLTENSLRYGSNYIRKIRVRRNGEVSDAVQISATTSDRPIGTAPILEDFSDTTLNFSFVGDWTVSNGAYINATILDGGTSSTQIDFSSYTTKPKHISFDYIVSSETNYDYFRFLVNGTEVFNDSGTSYISWRNYSYDLASGINVIQFQYTKDGSASAGTDNAKIDNLRVEFNQTLPPLTPTNLTGALLSSTSIRWSWTAGDNTETEYRIYNADTDQKIATIPVGATIYDESGISLGNTYNRYVTAYNAGGESPVASASFVFEVNPPTDIVGTAQSSSRILWSFTDVGFTEYRIYPFNNVSGTGTEIIRIKFENSTWNTYLITNLTTPIGSYSSPQWLQSGISANATKSIRVSSYSTNLSAEGRLSDPVGTATKALPSMINLNGQKLGLNNLKWTIS